MDQKLLEELTKKVGGRFKLTSLLQKRMVALMRMRREGEPALSGAQLLERATQEVAQGKVILVPSTEERFEALTGETTKEEKGKSKKKAKNEKK